MAKTNGALKTLLADYPEGFVAAKTGTVETGESSASSNGVFMCYAPAEDPQIAVTVVVEHGVYGGYVIPAIEGVIEGYFGGQYKRSSLSSVSSFGGIIDIINNSHN